MSGPCLCGDPLCGNCFPGQQQRKYALEQIPGYEHMLSQYRRAGLSAITAARRLRESLEEAVERCDLDRTTIYEGSQDTFNDIVTSVLARLVPGDGASR